MASKIYLSYRLEEVENRLARETEALQARGVAIDSRPEHHQQPEVNRVNLVEYAGAVMEAAGTVIDGLRARVSVLESCLTDHDIEVPADPSKGEETDADEPEGSADPEDAASGDAPEPDGTDAPVADPAPDAAGDAPVAKPKSARKAQG